MVPPVLRAVVIRTRPFSETSLWVRLYTASHGKLTGLAACLDVAKPGDQILVTSFGSGAGSDSFIIRCTNRLSEIQDKAPAVRDQLATGRIHLDYGKYVAYRGKIRTNLL